jgi:hypothetical protein
MDAGRVSVNWRTVRAPGGERYQRCLDCGRSRDIPPVTPAI